MKNKYALPFSFIVLCSFCASILWAHLPKRIKPSIPVGLNEVSKANTDTKPRPAPTSKVPGKQYLNAGKQLSFIENKGQITDQHHEPRTDIQYSLAAGKGLTIVVGNGAIHYQFSKANAPASKNDGDLPGLDFINRQDAAKGHSIAPMHRHELDTANVSYTMYRMDVELVGANKNAEIIAAEKQDYYENYFTPGTGESGAKALAYNRIVYKNVYPHIDWVLYTSSRQLKHEFVVHTGGRVSDIKLKYGGTTSLKINADGALVATTPQGAITEQAPYTYQQDGAKVVSSFKLKGDVLSYETGKYRGDLVIDPSLAWATYYGGEESESGTTAVATDSYGNVYLTGYTSSTGGIVTTGAHQVVLGGGGYSDAFLVKFNSVGVRQWATYYGGDQPDQAWSVATDVDGNIYIGGHTQSSIGIATVGAHQTTFILSMNWDAFLAKFNTNGERLWATYYGGIQGDVGFSVTTDINGNVYLAGSTNSTTGMATTGAYKSTYTAVDREAFVVKFSGEGVRQWGTYFGTSEYSDGWSVATDEAGNVYLAGVTSSSTGIATSGAYQESYGDGYDAFLAKFSSAGVRQWSTYYGGSGWDDAVSIDLDSSGNVYMAGKTNSSSGIASSGAHDTAYHGLGSGLNSFVAKFNSSGVRQWGTYSGGNLGCTTGILTTDDVGDVYLVGATGSTSGIATVGAPQTTYSGAFLMKFNSGGTKQWGTYFGGGVSDEAYSVAIDGIGNVFMAGNTGSPSGVATTGAHQVALGGGTGYDAFLAKFTDCVSPTAGIITGSSSVNVGATISLSDTTSGGTWSSSNAAIATISSVGVVTGIAAGSVIISYTVTNSCGSSSAVKFISVDSVTLSCEFWAQVGNPDFSLGEIGRIAITIDESGTKYVVYEDLANANKATVRKFNGSNWEVVGNEGFSAGIAIYTTIAVDHFGAPYVAYEDGANGYRTTVMKFNGTDWVTVGTAGFSAGPVNHTSIKINSFGIPYVTYQDWGTGGKATVKKFNGSTWVNVGIAGFSAGETWYNSLAFDNNDTLYVGYRDLANGRKTTVMKFNGTSWVTVGSSGFSASASADVSVAIDGDFVPYIAYQDSMSGYKASVMKYNGGSWVTVGGGAFSPTQADYTSLAIDQYGVPYVAFRDYTETGDYHHRASVMKFNGSIWISVGNPNFTEFGAASTSIALDSNGTPNVAFSNSSACVMMLTDSFPAIDGTLNVCQGYSTSLTNAVSDGIWSSGNILVASVNSSGEVAGISLGTAQITYSSGACFATTVVTVSSMPSAGTIAGPSSVSTGSTVALSNAASGGTWSSSNTAIATVGSTGIVTGIAAGTITISYTVANSCGSVSATHVVVVTASEGSSICESWSPLVSYSGVGNAQNTRIALSESGVPFVGYTDGMNGDKATVIKYNGSTWDVVGVPGFSEDVSGYTLFMDIAINGEVPYVVYPDHTNGFKATVKKFDGSNWINVGLPGFTTGEASTVSIAFDNSGLPFVAYRDQSNSYRATVMKFDGTSWGIVADAGFSHGEAQYTEIAVDTNNMPWVAYYDVADGGISTMRYNGSDWIPVGAAGFSDPTVESISFVIDENNMPYIAYVDGGNDWNAAVLKFDGSSWVPLGSGVVSDGTVSNTSLALDNSGSPYIVYRDLVNGQKAKVKKYNGSEWVTVGNSGSLGPTFSTSIAIDNTGTPFIAFMDYYNGRNVGVSRLDGSTWVGMMEAHFIPGGPNVGSSPAMAADTSGNPYVVYSDLYTLSGTTVMKYNNGQMEPVGDLGFTNFEAIEPTIAIDGSSIPYVAYLAGTDSGSYIFIYRFTGSEWNMVGPGILAGEWINTPTLAIDSFGVPYVAYMDGFNSNKVTVRKYNGINWVPVGSIGFSPGEGYRPVISITSNGVPYVAFKDNLNGGRATVMKFDGAVWVLIGAAGFSAGSIGYGLADVTSTPGLQISLTLDNSNSPYVAYRDVGNANKATVMKYNGSSWENVGSAGFSDGAVYSISITMDSIGVPFVAYFDSIDGGATCRKYNGSSWDLVGLAGFSSGVMYPSLAIGKGRTPYVCFVQDMTSIGLRMQVMKLDHAVSPIVGTLIFCTGSTTSLIDTTSGGIWNSSNTDVATVSTTGTVTGITAGTSVISYSVGDCNSTAVVTINPSPTVGTVTGLNFVCAGSTITLVDTTSGGSWSSSNVSRATVSSIGVVTGVSAGTTTISYTVVNLCGSASATKVITVNPAPTPGVITGPSFVNIGSTITLSNATMGGTWFSSNTSIATVNTTGVVTGIAAGTVTISYSVTNSCGTANATRIVTVNAALSTPITGTLSVCVGATTMLANATAGGSWVSGAPGIATVNATTGLVTGLAVGTATISYTLSGSSVTAVVTVLALPDAGTLSGAPSVCAGSTVTLTSTVSGGTWTSSNPSVATVGSTGIVSGLSNGTTTVSYIVTGSCVSTPATLVVTVFPTPGTITGTAAVCEGSSTTLSCNPGGGTWGSSAPSKATISATGTISGISAGTTTITYTVAAGCYSLREVTVNIQPSVITGTPTVCVGNSTTLSSSPSGGAWTSGFTGTATVGAGTGVVTGVSAGTTDITYTLGSGCRRKVTVTVVATPAAITGVFTLCAGNATMLGSATIGGTWSSGSTAVATVDVSTGEVTGVAAGTAAITYSKGGCMRTVVVTVNAGLSANTGNAVICEGQSTILANVTTGGSWLSADVATATVHAATGLVTAVAIGYANITYTVSSGCYAVTEVSVNPALGPVAGTLSVCQGGTTTLANGSTGGTWTSSNSAKATIGVTSGLLSGVAAGTATISYIISGGCYVTAVATINSNPATINGTATLCEGATTGLTCSPGGGTWSSSDALVATISTSGVATGTGGGTATISYTLSSGCASVRVVTVSALPDAISGSLSACIGASNSLSSTPSGGTWTSSSTYVATVGYATGILTGAHAGTARITYTVPGGCRTISVVTVAAAPGSISGLSSMCSGSTLTLSSATWSGVWSSSDGAVASVATLSITQGLVTGLTAGTTTISYTVGSCAATKVVTVTAGIAAITGDPVVCVGQGTALANATSGGTWSSSATAIATVNSSGVVAGVSAGTATITYRISTSCFNTTMVTVSAVPSAITGTLSVCPGATTALGHATAGGTWTSSNTTKATVDATTGIVTGVSSGTATITYALSAGCYRTAALTVGSSPASITGTAVVCAGSATSLACATSGGTWSTADAGIATVSGGLVAGVAVGTTTISYITGAGCAATRVVTVTTAPSAITGATTVCAGTTVTLSATPGGGTWSSSNASKATVGPATGIVTGVSTGTTNITYALSGSCYSVTNVTVSTSPAGITGPDIMCSGGTITLGCTTPFGVWSSSNTGVATIGAATGVVTGIGSGTTTISYAVGSCAATKVVTVNISGGAITGDAVVCVGQTNSTLTTGLTGGTWSSSTSAIANVHAANGLITGMSIGTATITYTISPGCFIARTATVNAAINDITGPATVVVGSMVTLANASAGGTWSSSNMLKATVGAATGDVTGISAGTSSITYLVSTGCYKLLTVTVTYARPDVSGVASGIRLFSVYPNPTSGSLTLESSVCGMLTLYSIDGKEIKRYSITTETTMLALPNELAAGVYMCKFNGDDGSTEMVRVVKM